MTRGREEQEAQALQEVEAEERESALPSLRVAARVRALLPLALVAPALVALVVVVEAAMRQPR